MRRLRERTIKSFHNNNLALFRFVSNVYDINQLEDMNHIGIKVYIDFSLMLEIN